MPNALRIGAHLIEAGGPPYIVAEISGNHNGDLQRALQLIEEAKLAGADAVKLQTYTASTLTLDHDGPGFVVEEGLWRGRRLHELYAEAATPWEWHEALFAKGQQTGITVFSSAFDPTAVSLLERLKNPAYKIASFEAVDTPLIELAAQTGKPLIISTGMATRGEIVDAVTAARRGGCTELALLHCISAYPTPARESNLRTISALRNEFDAVVGVSDHTLGIAVSVAAAALGAAIIEKHFTLRRSDGGPDAAFSLEPEELRALCTNAREAWESLGGVHFGCTDSEKANREFRRSLYVVADMDAGERFSSRNVRSIRPAYGLPPKHLNEVLGCVATRAIGRGTPLSWELVSRSPDRNAGASGERQR